MKQFVIIGNSAAGIAAVEAIRNKDKESKITVISDEDYPAYCRCLISYYLAGDVKEDKLLYRPENFYRENHLELILNKKVTQVNPKKNRIVCEDKSQINFDALLIATGAAPKFPEIPGIKKRGVFGLRTIKDTKEIEGLVPVTKTACILGGGLIGLKAAYALNKRKVEVKVIIRSPQVLSQMLDAEAAGFLQKRLEENGIEVVLGQDVTEIIGNGDIKAVKLSSGKVYGCSLVIAAKGVVPNIDLIKETEIKINKGIIASNLLQTNIPNIYTAGDVCESFDIASVEYEVNALWPIAVEQGKTAGRNMCGEKINYAGSLGMNSLEFFGLPIVSLGIYKVNPVRKNISSDAKFSHGVKEDTASFEVLKTSDTKRNIYKKLILKNNVIVGAICLGKVQNSGIFLRLIRERIEVSSLKDKLMQENFGYPEMMHLVKDKEKIYV